MGYTLDLVYPSVFVLSQTPLHLRWAAVCAGAPHKRLSAGFAYLDLGCGDGSTLNLLAACYPRGEFVGIDINADHIDLARRRAEDAGLGNVSYVQASFADLETLGLKTFDFIAIYGVYSWLSTELQRAVHSFAAGHLAADGLFGVHYACQPGTAVFDPLGNLLRTISEARQGDSSQRVQRGLEDLRRLLPGSGFLEQNPRASELVASLARIDPGMLAHDVLNRQMHSFYSAEVHGLLGSLGMNYLGSANLLPNYPELTLSAAAWSVYRDITANAGQGVAEAARDFLLNPVLRFDVFGKAGAAPAATDRRGRLGRVDDLYLQRATGAEDLEARRRASADRAADLTTAVCTAVLELAEAESVTVAGALASPALAGYQWEDVGLAIEHLFARGFLHICVQAPVTATYRSDARYRLTSALNRQLLAATAASPGAEGLASPVLGSTIAVPQGARLGLMALTGGDLEQVWDELNAQGGLRLTNAGGEAVNSALQFREAIENGLPQFAATTVPELLRIGILEEAG